MMEHPTPTVALILIGSLLAGCAVAGDIDGADKAIVPGRLKAVPTLLCVGLHWEVQGDLNGNAVATVAFREAGAVQWKKAMSLLRVVPQKVDVENDTCGGIKVIFLRGLKAWPKRMRQILIDRNTKNYLAGSVFNLKPATKYELKVALEDPDGGGTTKTIRATTRRVPAIPKGGNRIRVRGGGDALAKAVANAKPGDIFVVEAGTYSGIALSASGTADAPICITPAGDGEVLLHGPTPEQERRPGKGTGVTVNGSYIHINGLRIKSFGIGVRIGRRKDVSNVSVTRCHITGAYTCLRANGSDGYFADNILVGTFRSGTEGHGVHLEKGTGSVVCYNRISKVADGTRLYRETSDSDFYGNDVLLSGDDALETDYSGPNARIWGNRLSYTGANGVSFQPYIGGPAYLIRNLVINADENTIKDRYNSAGLIMINNTMVAKGKNAIIQRTYARNNLFITLDEQRGRAMRYHMEDFLRQPNTLDADYNGYNGTLEGKKWHIHKRPDHNRRPLAEFRKATGLEKHGVLLTAKACFAAPLPTKLPRNKRDVAFKGTHPDLRLKAGSPAIDRGIVIPNIVENCNGKAPDLGALEHGAPLPHWGPRDEAE